MNRRELVAGVAAAAIARPVAAKDGVALGSALHPLGAAVVTEDLTEASLLRMCIEVQKGRVHFEGGIE